MNYFRVNCGLCQPSVAEFVFSHGFYNVFFTDLRRETTFSGLILSPPVPPPSTSRYHNYKPCLSSQYIITSATSKSVLLKALSKMLGPL